MTEKGYNSVPTDPPPPYTLVSQPGSNLEYHVQNHSPPSRSEKNPQQTHSDKDTHCVIITTGLPDECNTPQSTSKKAMRHIAEVPMAIVCPYCLVKITTVVEYRNGFFIWMMCCFLCFVGWFLGCCLLPLCLSSMKDVHHYCPNCHHHLGTKRRM